MANLFNNIYKDRTVLVTGHTGFKGAWLTMWLLQLGANVVGYSLAAAPTEPNMFVQLGIQEDIEDVRGDIRDYQRLQQTVEKYQPSIVFHLAAQPIVLHSIEQPRMTFDVNTLGTVNVLETLRHSRSVRAAIMVTTDKVYSNQQWTWGYRESDLLGGKDPYSASKAMAELAVASYRSSYFGADRHDIPVASARAGNVIGGGDFADYRLVPDCIRALMANEAIGIRIPGNIRPWQHVLVALSGYLWLAARLVADGQRYASAWNFAPPETKGVSVAQLVERLVQCWGSGSWIQIDEDQASIETPQLKLNWDKAAAELNWHPVYDWQQAVAETVNWYQAFAAGAEMRSITKRQIDAFVRQAYEQDSVWTR